MTGTQYPTGTSGSTGTAGDRRAAWHAVVGSARGAAHQVRGLPNQDAAAWQDVPGSGIVVAIADGHGHARHFRSAEGSALAVGVACREAARLAAVAAQELPTVTAARAAARDLTLVIVADWRAAVAGRLAGAPYTAQELAVLEAAGDDPEVPYGSTLLVAVIAGPWLVCAQIGDGDMLGVRPDGGLLFPVPGDDRLEGHQTTSLCQPDAEESFRAEAHDLRETPLAALLAATDGYGNAQAEEPWQPGVGRDLAELAAGRDAGWFEQQVPEWARRCASSEGSGDDTTIALLLARRTGDGSAPGGEADGAGEAAAWTD
jgi:Protein phosphatase 2C